MASNLIDVLGSLRAGEIVTFTLGLGLSTLTVCARVYTRMCLTKKVRLEDYLAVLAWLSFGVYIVLGIVISRNGGNVKYLAYLTHVESKLYCPIITIVKISILLQYITVFVPHRQGRFYYAVHILIWANVLCYTVIIIISIAVCPPERNGWNTLVFRQCNFKYEIWVITGTLNLVSDFSILVFPFPVIWRLQMPWNTKFRVMMIFGFGFLACITSVLRLIYSIEIFRVRDDSSTTVYLNEFRVALCSYAEIAVGIIVGCLPALPRFFRHIYPRRSSPAFIQNSSDRPSWRSLFRKLIRPYASSSETRAPSRKFFSSRSKAPYISTLNFAGDSFHMTERDFPEVPAACKSLEPLAPIASGFGAEEDPTHPRPDDAEMASPVARVMKNVHINKSRAASYV